ncbi:MAG: VWA-like domain-containing protein [Flavobacteriales bacterium]|nr:VWA-like domain-containing protein [Flavobacteriales bacterium]
MNSSKIIEEISRTSIDLLMKEPFYSHILSCLNKIVVSEDSAIQTMAVGIKNKNHVVYVNPDFWNNVLVEKKLRYGVFKHEILHIVLKHTVSWSIKYDRHLMNIAMDIVVNQYILREHLPEDGVFLDTFPDLDLEPNQSWQYYYEKLKHLQQNQGQHPVSAQNLSDISESSHGLDRHGSWEKHKALTPLEKELAKDAVDNLVKIAHQKTDTKSWGSLPGYLKVLLEDIIINSEPYVSWRHYLKLFTASSSKTRLKTTIKRPSKRYGTVPGIKIKKKQRILVTLDTSGSIGKDDIEQFFSEVYHVWLSGAEVQVIECDTDIHNIFTFKGSPPAYVMGQGGTDFDAPIIKGNELRPDCMIYFTDGYAPDPKTEPKYPMLWVITENGITIDEFASRKLPGRIIKMKNEQ